ncbi:hypothetical protein G6F58_010245 [Rhizopus delemar]|nr:hypothetical protein G6F58_010245 [Rhizopus delemar]
MNCTYKESTRKRGPPKGYIEAIEGRLHRLEALLGSIIQEDDPRSQAILAEINAPIETAYGELVRPRPTVEQEEFQPREITNPVSKDEENANDNLGNLSIDESGQLRYYGKSSGFYMLQGSKNFQNGAFHFNSRGYRSGISQCSLDVDPFELPPPDLSKHLLELYFTHFYPLLPLIHKKSFLTSLKSEDVNKRPPPLLLNAIYAVASRISSDIRVRANPDVRDTAGDIFLERARILLDQEWDDYKLSTVQSLILLSSHQNGALKNIRGWLYSGLAFRMCQNLGLNRNCDSWNLSDSEKEERKRVFYCSFVIDRLSCAMHGRAPMIDERDYDTPYPSEVDEDDKQNKPTIMDNFHQLIKLCEILGDILCQLYMVKGRRHVSALASPDSVISKLDRALNSWMSKLPPSIQYLPPNTKMAEKSPPPKLEVCQTHMLFYTTLILLHRPFIPGPLQKRTSSVFPSASICTFAANKILDIVECLMADGRLKNINNYTLYTMFTAGIIFINDASSNDPDFAFEAKLSVNKIIKAMDEVETTWITSARHCNILGELAGLRDINLENVDEGFDRQTIKNQSIQPSKALSIAVPNSPLLQQTEAPSLEEFRNPIDAQYATEQRFPEYLTQYANSSSFQSDSPSSQSIQNTVDYNMNNRFTTNGQSFNPIGTAFWDVPMSFDIDQWNSYFNNQNYSK